MSEWTLALIRVSVSSVIAQQRSLKVLSTLRTLSLKYGDKKAISDDQNLASTVLLETSV